METESLILPSAHFLLWAAILSLAALAFWTDTLKLGSYLSGAAVILIVSMLLSNTNILPKNAPAYNTIWSDLVPLAISLLLFKADFRRVFKETKSMVVAFMLGTIGTLAGAVIGFFLLPLGEEANNLAGIFSATYIGGSMNMVAVAKAVELDSSLMSASVAADNVVGVLYLVLLTLMPTIGILRRWLPSIIINTAEQQSEQVVTHGSKAVNFNLLEISLIFTLGLSICATAYFLAAMLGLAKYSILFITTITVIIANVFPKKMARLEGDQEIGLLLMYLFFAVVGASADIGKMVDSALWIILFAVVIVLCHMLVIFIGSRFFKLDLAEVIIASNACTLGPSTAAALAAGNHWYALVTPAVLLGVFGYVVANFLGVLVASIL